MDVSAGNGISLIMLPSFPTIGSERGSTVSFTELQPTIS